MNVWKSVETNKIKKFHKRLGSWSDRINHLPTRRNSHRFLTPACCVLIYPHRSQLHTSLSATSYSFCDFSDFVFFLYHEVPTACVLSSYLKYKVCGISKYLQVQYVVMLMLMFLWRKPHTDLETSYMQFKTKCVMTSPRILTLK